MFSVPLSSKTYYCSLFLSLCHFIDTVLLALFILLPVTNCSLFLSWREFCCSQYAYFRHVFLPPSSCLNPATNFSSNSSDFCIVSFQLQYWKVSSFLAVVIQSGISWFNRIAKMGCNLTQNQILASVKEHLNYQASVENVVLCWLAYRHDYRKRRLQIWPVLHGSLFFKAVIILQNLDFRIWLN